MGLQRLPEITDELLIGGRLVGGEGEELRVVNPASEDVVAVVRQASARQLGEAVAAARAALDEGPWPRLSGAEPAARLEAAADHLAAHRDLLTDTLVAELGCPVSVTRMFQVEAGLQFFRWYADAARKDRSRPLPAETGPVPTE